MKISYQWLKQLVPDLQHSPEDLAHLLTMHSFEVEIARTLAIDNSIRVAKIVRLEPHPNADRLRLATITDGQQEVTVVCGAPNIAAGAIVPFSAPGAELHDEDGQPFILKPAKIRGVASHGMLNSLSELGLHTDHSGIWILPSDTPVGSPLAEHLPPDTILEADITPNRAHDSLSHVGLAREIAALLNLTVKEPSTKALPAPESSIAEWTVTIADGRLCQRYFAAVLDGLTVAPSPLWLQARLLAAGGKPINNLVDITNYVMFEYGNPTHLFDRQDTPGRNINIRAARDGEEIVTLDEVKHPLSPQDLLITMNDEPVAIAGIMGGQIGQVKSTTQQGLLEIANFNGFSVQETSRRLNIRSESSVRFSKNLDPNLVQSVAQRAVELFQEIAGAQILGVIDNYRTPAVPRTVAYHPEHAARLAGCDITTQESIKILERLRFELDTTKTPWSVTIPSDRLDVQSEHDLAEEVIRVVGVDTIKSSNIAQELNAKSLPSNIVFRELVRDTLVNLGLTETYNYAFEPQQYSAAVGLAEQEHITTDNPIAPDRSALRVSLLPGLLENAANHRELLQRNAGKKEGAIFEIGNTFRPDPKGGRVPGVSEELHVAAVIVGDAPSLYNIAAELGDRLGINQPSLINVITAPMQQALKFRLPLYAFELNLADLIQSADFSEPTPLTLEDIQQAPELATQFTAIPKYPAVYRDLSILVGPSVSIEQVQEIIERVGGQLVIDVDLFDEYQPTNMDYKGLAFHLTYQSPDKTLTDEEVGQLHNEIITSLKAEIAAQPR